MVFVSAYFRTIILLGGNMKITQLKILNDGDIVDKVEGNNIFVRGKDSNYYIYTFTLDENQSAIEYDVMVIKKGGGAIKINLDADLNDLKEAKEE